MKMTRKDKKRIPAVQEEQFNTLVKMGEIFIAKYNRLVMISKKYKGNDPGFDDFIERCLDGAECGNNVDLAYYYVGINMYDGEITFKNWVYCHNHLARINQGIGWLEAGLAFFAKSEVK